MNYLIFNGKSTQSIPGIAVSLMPSHKRASMRYTEFTVKNRDGTLHIPEGYSNIELKAKIVLLDAKPETRLSVNAWATGYGRLITSDDPSRAYKAQILREINWSRIKGNKGFFDEATINFDCDPFLYEASETSITFTSNGRMLNPGTVYAIPLLQVYGSGDTTFTVAGSTVTIKGMTSGQPINIDCENGYIYGNSGAKEMIGDYPEIPVGISNVSLGTNCSKIVITPHWRWV